MINNNSRYVDILQNHMQLINSGALGPVQNVQFYMVRAAENINGFQNHYLANRFALPTVGGEIAAVYDPLNQRGINVSLIKTKIPWAILLFYLINF